MCLYWPVWSNTGFQTTNTTVERDCSWSQETWNSKYINNFNGSQEHCEAFVQWSIVYAVITQFSTRHLYENENITKKNGKDYALNETL